MNRIACAVMCLSVLLLAVLLGGCGGGNSGTPVLAGLKIDDVFGMLGGETKPDPLATPAEAQAQPESLATPLVPAAAPKTGVVAHDLISWYGCLLPADSAIYVVTLQPRAATEDTDLYLFKPAPGGLGRIGSSCRGHNGNTVETPDWLSTGTTATAGRYQIAVYGYSPTVAPGTNHYTVEVDRAVTLATNGTAKTQTVAPTGSSWFSFMAVGGSSYTVTTSPSSGDPDLFVYGSTSDTLKGKSRKAVGPDAVTFTATVTGRHFVRVYGVSASTFTAKVKLIALRPILFASDRDGNNEIYRMDWTGGNQTRLTNTAGAESCPSWSPDGSKIVFVGEAATWQICVMNADGSGGTQLTADSLPIWNLSPTWSPDGSRIAWASTRAGNIQIYVMYANGSGQTQVTNAATNSTHPCWSPDGSRIVFTRGNAGLQLWAMDPDGSNQTQLTTTVGYDGYSSYSPDGTQIVFASARAAGSGIYVMDSDGSNQTRLTISDSPAQDWCPFWSANGKQITFTRQVDGNYQIYAMNADGSGLTACTSGAPKNNWWLNSPWIGF